MPLCYRPGVGFCEGQGGRAGVANNVADAEDEDMGQLDVANAFVGCKLSQRGIERG